MRTEKETFTNKPHVLGAWRVESASLRSLGNHGGKEEDESETPNQPLLADGDGIDETETTRIPPPARVAVSNPLCKWPQGAFLQADGRDDQISKMFLK